MHGKVPGKKMKIMHISDIHFRNDYIQTEEGYLSILAKMTSPLKNLKKCFEMVDKSCLDAVVVTGDLTEDGTETDYATLKAFLESELGDLPLCVTIGNHDNKPAFRSGWGLPSNVDEGAPYNTTLLFEGGLIISLDNAILGFPNGAIMPDQLLWLRDQMSRGNGRKKILIIHHHLLPNQSETPPAQWDSEFYDLILKSDLDGILCGHSHYSYLGSFAGKPYATAPSMSFRGKSGIGDNDVLFEEKPGFQICHFSRTGLEVTPYYLYEKPIYIKTIKIGLTSI